MSKLGFVKITLRPREFGSDAREFRVDIQKDGEVHSESFVIEQDDFKSFGEEALDRCVRHMKHTLGWKT